MNKEIKIIIVDDDEQDIATLKTAIERYAKECKLPIGFEIYQDALQFSNVIREISADIIFLDICMPNVTGMELARKLREFNQTINIIFSTNMAQYAVEGYSVRAIDFLLKPIQYEGVKRALDGAVHSIVNKANIRDEIVINDKISKETIVLPLEHIIYIEANNHFLTYYTTQGVFEEWCQLKAKVKQLSSRFFGRCHTSFVVSFKYIRLIRNDEIVLKQNDAVLPISRSYKKEFLIAFAKYMGS